MRGVGALATVVAVSLPCSALAADLGNLHLKSALGQPLEAEIDLVSVRKGERIVAYVGSQRAYQLAAVEYSPIASRTRVEVRHREDGRPYLYATTATPVNEPIVHLVVQVEGTARDVIGHYPLLLDPPLAAQPARAATPASGAAPALAPASAPAAETAQEQLALVKPPGPPAPTPREAAETALENPRFTIARYEIEGGTRIRPDVLERALTPFTGPNKDFDAIQSAVAMVQKTYADSGYGAVRVVIPEQDIENGVVRLQVAEARVGTIEVVGNKFYTERNIRASVPELREGEIPNVNRIGLGLRLANEASTKNTQLTFTQAAEPMLVNATLRVADASTRRWALSADNTGNNQTGRWRIGVAYLDTNLWDRDHTLGLQIVTSPEKLDGVVIAGGSYKIPLYSLGGALEFVAGHSDVDSGSVNTPAGTYGIRGSGTFAGMHYIHLLPRLGEWDQRLIAGLDYRSYTNNVLLQGGPPGSLVPDFQTLPVSLTYAGFMRGPAAEWYANASLIQNIPYGSNGTTSAFQAPGGRAGAEASYTILRYSVEGTYTLPRDWKARGALYGQETADALIPGEQFAVGGIDSVRGFGERVIANDRGTRVSLELYTPQVDAFGRAQGRFLAFVDAAELRRNMAQPGEQTRVSVSSAGLGLRATIGGAQLRLDSAFVLDGNVQATRGSNRTHARLIYLF